MRVDELRRELADLAAEIPPFGNDVRLVRRTVARRRMVIASVVVVVVALAAASIVAAVNTTRRHVEIIAPRPSKQVTPSRLKLNGDGALVVIAKDANLDVSIQAQQALERSDIVEQYTRLPWGVDPLITPRLLARILPSIHQPGFSQQSVSLGWMLLHGLTTEAQHMKACSSGPANLSAFAAQLAPTPDTLARLGSALGHNVAVYSLGTYKAPDAELLVNVLGGLRSSCPKELAAGRIGAYQWTFSVSPPNVPYAQHPTPGPEPGLGNPPHWNLDYRGEDFFDGPNCSFCPVAWVFADTTKDGQWFMYGAVPEVITEVTTTEAGASPKTAAAVGDGTDDHWKFFVIPLGNSHRDVTIRFVAAGSTIRQATFRATDTVIGIDIP